MKLLFSIEITLQNHTISLNKEKKLQKILDVENEKDILGLPTLLWTKSTRPEIAKLLVKQSLSPSQL